MKVGDLVKCDFGFGVVVGKYLNHDGPLYRVVFYNSSVWARPHEMTVIS